MNIMFDDIIRNLEEWAQEQNLIEKAIESCKVSIRNCATEETELFPTMNTGTDVLRGRRINDIQLHFDKQSLVFKHGVSSYPFIDTQIGLYVADPTGVYFRDLEPIGTYRLIAAVDGEMDGDYLVLDDELRAQE